MTSPFTVSLTILIACNLLVYANAMDRVLLMKLFWQAIDAIVFPGGLFLLIVGGALHARQERRSVLLWVFIGALAYFVALLVFFALFFLLAQLYYH